MSNLIGRISALWAVAGGLLLIAIMVVTSTNVTGFVLDRIARMFGGTVPGLSGYEDFVRLTIACAALMFLPYCQHRRGHVAVDLFVKVLPPTLRRWLDRLWLAATVLLALFLVYWMLLGMLETRSDNIVTPILGWPEWPSYAPGIVSLILWALVALQQVFERSETDA